MKKAFSMILLALVFFFSYGVGGDEQASVSNLPDGYYLVSKVVDGDTVEVEREGEKYKIRLIGVDTPETVHPSKPVECFGKEASNRTKELLLGKQVELEEDLSQSNKDRYGRLLRYIITQSGRNVNKMLIEDGYAYEYTYGSTPYKYQIEFKDAQKRAQEHGYGLWNERTCNGEK